MTVPHDEQPLTRRQLRDLERQKPRKQQKEEAKAAEEAEAKRRADEAARAAAERAAFEAEAARAVLAQAAVDAPVAPQTAAVRAAVADAPAAAASQAADGAQIAAEVGPEQPSGGSADAADAAPAPATDDASAPPAPFAESAAPAPILSRRARRALSADHPFAEQQSAEAVHEPEHPAATGPIIAELVADEHNDDVVETESSESTTETAEVMGDHEPAMVEELMVVDEPVAPELLAEEAEELAEIDDTPEPEEVQIVTIDETPSAPILAPMFQAKSADREVEVNKVELNQASFDDLIATRGVGASNSVASTSALVLPSVPNHGDVGTALDETGEVIITGSIDLPMSLGSTGAAPADGLESSELDAFLDPESEVGSDVAPVSATRAVSTHGPSSGLVAPPKRRGSNAPVILAVTAGVLAVGVVGLLLAAFVFRIF